MHQPNVLTRYPERLQMLAVAIRITVIEQADHLVDVIEVLREFRWLDPLKGGAYLIDPECWGIVLLDGLDESLVLDGDIGWGETGR
jgi:hypothetical protein